MTTPSVALVPFMYYDGLLYIGLICIPPSELNSTKHRILCDAESDQLMKDILAKEVSIGSVQVCEGKPMNRGTRVSAVEVASNSLAEIEDANFPSEKFFVFASVFQRPNAETKLLEQIRFAHWKHTILENGDTLMRAAVAQLLAQKL